MRVITAKIGPDDHYRGVHAVSQALRDAGIEVIFLGLGQRVDRVVAAAEQEDVDVIALGFHYGGEIETIRRLMQALRDKDLGHVRVIVGGMIPPHAVDDLRAEGVVGIFPPGSTLESIVSCVRGLEAAER
jgi:methylmalonyl-CoA mutase, C-terminal domain